MEDADVRAICKTRVITMIHYSEAKTSHPSQHLMFIVLVVYQDKKKKYEPPIPTRVGKKQKKTKGPDAANKLPQGTVLKIHPPSYQDKFLKGVK